ncbi:hypothetical protein [Nocardia noduli]|uniref:hypothetical protein n=1 Tax=Nocardia noduli TaxID=2815722 RepID=UPI001C21E06B|nr:hypothetical protein [Nocardia noduli]
MTDTDTAGHPGPSPTGQAPSSLVAELRELATSAPAHAAASCWDHLRRTGSADDRDLLAALFAQGAPPRLNGDYEGLIVGKLFGIPEAALLNPVITVRPGWVGKGFDAATETGYNRLDRLAYSALRVAVPRHRGWRRSPEGVYHGFRFRYRVEPSVLPPFRPVVAVTYTDPALGAPAGGLVPMDRIRDEIVELVPGVCLGRASMASRAGEVKAIGYFALRAVNR